MLNELKLMKSYTENTLKENDIVVVFQGMVYIFSYDDSMQKEYNIGMVIQDYPIMIDFIRIYFQDNHLTT